MRHESNTMTGMVVTLQWSRQGKWAERKHHWGVRAAKTWGAEKLGEGLWSFPKSVPHADVHDWLVDRLTAADRAVVTFPHGTKDGASSMSVHTYNV